MIRTEIQKLETRVPWKTLSRRRRKFHRYQYIRSEGGNAFYQTCTCEGRKVQSNHVNINTEGAIEGVHIKWVEFRENVKAFFPQKQGKLSVIMNCPY